MSLRSKIVLILAAVLALYVVLDVSVQRTMVAQSFVDLEREEAGAELELARKEIRAEVDQIEHVGRGWAAAGTPEALLAHFVPQEGSRPAGGDEGREDEPASPMAALEVDLVYLVEADGTVAWSRVEDPETRAAMRLRDFPSEALAPFHPLMLSSDGSGLTAGLMMTERGVLAVCTSPIREKAAEDVRTGDEGAGPLAAGARAGRRLIVGRLLDRVLAAAHAESMRTRLACFPLRSGELPQREAALLDSITTSTEPVTTVTEDEHLYMYTVLADVRGAPSILLRAEVERRITARGASVIRFALLSTAFTVLLILFVLLRILQRTVLDPIGRLTGHAVAIGKNDDTSARVGMERGDEIGTLATEFDRMIGKLAQSRAAHAEAARLVGMSEIATGVLHDIGNVLNSVSVSARLSAGQVRKLPVGDLEKVMEILRGVQDDMASFVANDPRGKHLVPFLDQVTTNLAAERAKVVDEMGKLAEGIEHIERLVRSQQDVAGAGPLLEPVSIAHQLESALRLAHCAGQGVEGDAIRVETELEDLPMARLDKHKLTEILVNLIRNACDSLDLAGKTRLVLRARRRDADTVRIEVEDEGVGIPAQDLSRIFNHGFTTKPQGHGFGLHTSANAAAQMHGRLFAESAGPGLGALFVLEVPLDAEATARAA